MNYAHIHIVINHIPIVGQFFSMLLILLSLYFKDQEGVILSAVLIMLISAGGALAAYFSGSPSIKLIAPYPGVGHRYIQIHFKRAKMAMNLSLLSALIGLICGVVILKAGAPIPIYCYVAIFIASFITSVSMIFTGNAGGKIRHQEVRGEESSEK